MRAAVVLVVALLALPAAANPMPPQVRPLQVALDALPDALASAIREAEDHLLADEAQRDIDELQAYVQGFRTLPDGGLQEVGLQEAYAWTQDVVEAFTALPGLIARMERAGNQCAYGDDLTSATGAPVVSAGRGSYASLRHLADELAALAARAPTQIDATPVQRSFDLLTPWLDSEGVDVQTCIVELAERLGLSQEFLDAILVPSIIHPGGRVRVVGSLQPAGPVAIAIPTLGIAQEAAASDIINASFIVPRAAALGNHTVHLASGEQALDLKLVVAKQPTTLRLDVPRRVLPDSDIRVAIRVDSRLGTDEVDRAAVRLEWTTASMLALSGGRAATTLATGEVGSRVLTATYEGTEALAASRQSVAIVVAEAPEAGVPSDGPLVNPPGASGFDVLQLIVLVLVASGAALAIAVVIRRRRRRPAPAGAPESRETFPESSFADAVGWLFGRLRASGTVPPGRTVREWVTENPGPVQAADDIDRIRYGGAPEAPTTRRRGLAWLRGLWARRLP